MSSSHQLLDSMFTCWAATESPYLADIQQQFGSQTSLTRLFCWSVGRLTVGEVSAVASEGAAFTAGEDTMWSTRPSLPPAPALLAGVAPPSHTPEARQAGTFCFSTEKFITAMFRLFSLLCTEAASLCWFHNTSPQWSSVPGNRGKAAAANTRLARISQNYLST